MLILSTSQAWTWREEDLLACSVLGQVCHHSRTRSRQSMGGDRWLGQSIGGQIFLPGHMLNFYVNLAK
jgi:hypothetical protein